MRPLTTRPPPVPVPMITPNTTAAPAAAPSVASDNAKQLASLARRTGRAERLREVIGKAASVQPRGVGVLDETGRGRDRAGNADAHPTSRLRRFVEAGSSRFDARSCPPDRRWRGRCRRSCRAARRCGGDRARVRHRRARGLRSSSRRDRCRCASGYLYTCGATGDSRGRGSAGPAARR